MDFKEYNITIRLGSLLSLPSKFLQRLRRIDDMLNHDLEAHHTTAGLPMPVTPVSFEGRTHVARPPPSPESLSYELIAMPGAFAFITSGYALGLLAMTLILNRIQHIVVPPRRSMAYRLVRNRRSFFHALFYTFFPIDLSLTAYRFVLRIPSLYYLYKTTALFFVILLQAYSLFPSTQLQWLQPVDQWAGQKEMSDVCWSVYGAVCFALIIGALTRGLEGVGTSNASPFNLFGYAMLLHIYASPITHTNKGYPGHPSRPDKNVLVTLFLPLFQLAIMHSLGVSKRWSQYRLVPTAACSFATLIHFNYVLISKPTSYPLLNYLPCLLETILFLITLLTISLNVLTQVLLEGQVTRPLFGHARTLAPKWDEDFANVLLRLGTASLEATSVAGLGKELGPVPVGHTEILAKSSIVNDGIVELGSGGVLSITPSKASGGRCGFANEIKAVKVKTDDDSLLIDQKWLRGLLRYGLALLGVIRGFYRLALWVVWYRWRGSSLHRFESEGQAADAKDKDKARPSPNTRSGINQDEDIVYQRFLSGETVSDDDDTDYSPHDAALDNYSNQSSDNDDDQDDELEESDSGGKETAILYSDILEPSATAPSTSPGPVLFAHMTSSDTPLTRRRYNQLVSNQQRQTSQSDDVGWLALVQERRALKASTSAEASLEGRMTCVVCTTEPREVICWPCRCLALCDDCRENLASRFAASKHSCPCCRRSVEGYSRIYIP